MAAITAGTAPEFYAINMGNTAQSGNAKPVFLDVAEMGGRIRIAYDSFIAGTTGTWAKDKIVHVAVLPKGAKIWRVRIHQSGSGGNSKTISCGYLPTDGTTAGDDVKFLPATVATGTDAWLTTVEATAGVGFALPAESGITLTHAGGTGAFAASTIKTVIEWTID